MSKTSYTREVSITIYQTSILIQTIMRRKSRPKLKIQFQFWLLKSAHWEWDINNNQINKTKEHRREKLRWPINFTQQTQMTLRKSLYALLLQVRDLIPLQDQHIMNYKLQLNKQKNKIEQAWSSSRITFHFVSKLLHILKCPNRLVPQLQIALLTQL